MNEQERRRDSVTIEQLDEMVRELGERTRMLNEDAKKQSAHFRSLCEQSEVLIRASRRSGRPLEESADEK
jgi:hypothetical protein